LEARQTTSPVTIAVDKAYRYTIDKDDILKWIDVFCDIYGGLESLMLESDKTTVKKQRPSGGTIIKIFLKLDELNALLRSKFLDHLLEDAGASKLFKLRPNNHTNEASMSRLLSGEDADSSTVDGDNDESTITSEDLPEIGELPRSHFIRYLKTVTDHIAAFKSIRNQPAFHKPIKAHVVYLPKPDINRELVINELDAFLDSVVAPINDKDDRDDARDWIKKEIIVKAVMTNPAVHAEAGMMGLVNIVNMDTQLEFCSGPSSELNGVLASVLKTDEVVIGVSKKCCWCCWRLYKWFEAHRSSPAAPGQDSDRPSVSPTTILPTMLLIGSHDTIFPWCPPQLGIPIEFLRELLKDLKHILMKVSLQKTADADTHQNSARSPGAFDEEETYYLDLRDELESE